MDDVLMESNIQMYDNCAHIQFKNDIYREN
jgi:hypothetical protein